MQHAVVALKEDNAIKGITLDKYLASQMVILEECSKENLQDKVDYWTRIYNYPKGENVHTPMYHFMSKEDNKHVWSIHKEPALALKGLRCPSKYKLVSPNPQ